MYQVGLDQHGHHIWKKTAHLRRIRTTRKIIRFGTSIAPAFMIKGFQKAHRIWTNTEHGSGADPETLGDVTVVSDATEDRLGSLPLPQGLQAELHL